MGEEVGEGEGDGDGDGVETRQKVISANCQSASINLAR